MKVAILVAVCCATVIAGAAFYFRASDLENPGAAKRQNSPPASPLSDDGTSAVFHVGQETTSEAIATVERTAEQHADVVEAVPILSISGEQDYRAVSNRLAQIEASEAAVVPQDFDNAVDEAALESVLAEIRAEALRYPEESLERTAMLTLAEKFADMFRRAVEMAKGQKVEEPKEFLLDNMPPELAARVRAFGCVYLPRLMRKTDEAQNGANAAVIGTYNARIEKYKAQAERHPEGSIEREACLRYVEKLKSSVIRVKAISDRDIKAFATLRSDDQSKVRRSTLQRKMFLRGVPDDLLQRLNELDKRAFAAELRSYMSQARSDRETARALCRDTLPAEHALARRQQSLLADHDWLAGLSYSGRSIVAQAYRDAQLALESVTDARERAAILKKTVERLDDLNSPATYVLMRALIELAVASSQLDDNELAIAVGERVLRLSSSAVRDDPLLVYEVRSRVGLSQNDIGRYHDALRSMCIAQNVADEIGLVDHTAIDLLIGCAQIFETVDEYRRADECITKTYEILGAGAADSIPEARFDRAATSFEIAYETKRNELLQPLVDECMKISKNELAPIADYLASATMMSSRLLRRQNKFDEAWTLIDTTDKSLDSRKSKTWQASFLAQKFYIRTEQQRYTEAAELGAQYVNNFYDKTDEDQFKYARIFEHYAEALDGVGRTEEAKQAKNRARELQKMLAELKETIRTDPLCRLSWEQENAKR